MSKVSEGSGFSGEMPVIKPTDLRGILKYVPRFQGQIFVIALDGAIVADDNFGNLLVDVAVLRSLGIRIVLVHGIGRQLKELAKARGVEISNGDGTGVTDEKTLELAVDSATRVSQIILEGLTQGGLKCAITNAVRALPVGIIHGVDLKLSGKVDRVDREFLGQLLNAGVIPIVQPIGYGPEGRALRINSDLLAAEVAEGLGASKIIYLTEASGLEINGKVKREITVDALRDVLRSGKGGTVAAATRSKAVNAVHALERGVARAHVLDGRIFDGLINEIFSNEGVGTMVYASDYEQIRKATRKDARVIYNLTRNAVRREELMHRSLQAVEKAIEEYFVFEVDESIIACAALRVYVTGTKKVAEVGSLYVQGLHQRQGIGRKMVDYACMVAKERGVELVLALSTQTVSFFTTEMGFEETEKNVLPAERLKLAEENGRNARVLMKRI